MLTPYLNKVLAGHDLTSGEMEKVLGIMTGSNASCAQSGALLAALRMKGESLSELAGGARMLRRHAAFIDCGGTDVVDVVGTGGDGGISFNISTTSAMVAAGAGVPMAKHGNRAVSGKCGAADVLAELGFNLNVEPAVMENCIQNHGIGFLFAQKMHPVLGSVGVLRRELKIRTIFNMLGPLSNPAGAQSIVLGVYDAKLTELFAGTLKELGAKHAMVVHGHDGLDEISCCEPTRVSELKNGVITSYELYPEMLLGNTFDRSEIAGGDAKRNAEIMLNILNGKDCGATRAVVLLNAGAAIYVSGKAATLQEGMKLAEESIDSGRALEKLNILIRESCNE